ncbi:hypothetical protein CUMW_288020, partial [Citrus unshiu]
MVRAPTYDENGMKKGAWSKEEDDNMATGIGVWQELQAAMDELPEARHKTRELHQRRRGYYHQITVGRFSRAKEKRKKEQKKNIDIILCTNCH